MPMKVFNIIKNVLVWAIVAFAVGMMIFTVISVNAFDQNSRSLFGYKFFVVRTDSMAATDFDAGDIVIIKETDPRTLVEGDIIAYLSQNSQSYGETVTHKIRTLTRAANGDPGFVTYGTTTGVDDEIIVTYPYVLGKYVNKLPGVGTFFLFLKQPQGYFLCIFTPFLLLILYQGLNCVRIFKMYKAEQMEELEAEKAALEKQRQESEAMMAQLLEMKKQMTAQAPPAEDPAVAAMKAELEALKAQLAAQQTETQKPEEQ